MHKVLCCDVQTPAAVRRCHGRATVYSHWPFVGRIAGGGQHVFGVFSASTLVSVRGRGRGVTAGEMRTVPSTQTARTRPPPASAAPATREPGPAHRDSGFELRSNIPRREALIRVICNFVNYFSFYLYRIKYRFWSVPRNRSHCFARLVSRLTALVYPDTAYNHTRVPPPPRFARLCQHCLCS